MNIDFSLIEMQNIVETSLKLLYEQVHTALSKHAPLKQKRVRWQIQPGWFNDEIKKSTHERDCFYKNRDFENSKRARNKTTSLFRKSKVNLFNKAISENQNINYLWKHLKDINEQGPLSTLPEVMQQDSKKVSDKKEIAIICN